MIYKILKPIVRLSLRAYFRRIDVIGRQHIPGNGPIIFVSNHPSALMDPLMVASFIQREVHFLAGSEWFGKGLKAKLFKRQLNMIPVYRPWLAKGKKISNQDMFEACYEAMNEGHCLILFPEASTETVSKIRELKTGAVRIKHGFDSQAANQEVPIIPIGLSYSNPHLFQSRVIVKIGEPVVLSNSEATEDLKELFRAQTEQVRASLKKTIVHIDNTQNEDLVSNISRLYMDRHQDIESLSLKNSENQFDFNRNVALAVEHFERERPEDYQRLSRRIHTYFDDLCQLQVSDDYVGHTDRSSISWVTWTFLVVAFPVALLSLIVFSVPYQLTKLIFLRKFRPSLSRNKEPGTMDTAFSGTLIFGVGTLIFLAWAILITSFVGAFFGWIPGVVTLVTMYPLFRFGLLYAKIRTRFRAFFKNKKIREKNQRAFELLEKERFALIQELDRFSAHYGAASR